jgi:hypothetical protein
MEIKKERGKREREGGREARKEGGREEGRKKEGRKEEGKKEGRKGVCVHQFIVFIIAK